MRRFYLPPEALNTPEPVISGPDANHIKNVLRLKPGQTIAVFDGQGNAYEAVIRTLSTDSVAISPGAAVRSEPNRPVEITLAQALLKSGKMDTLVRQITELGIARWAPFIAERSVPRPDPGRAGKKRARWETIAREAMKQCGRNRMPEVGGVAGFDDILEMTTDTDLSLIFYEAEKTPIDLLSLSESMPRPKTLLIIVGPEGGFTESEIERAEAFNILRGSLGPRILRAETAALAAATLIQFLFGDMREKTP
jgi:16S rRNA (uracil1498-N3)-methyltransferase